MAQSSSRPLTVAEAKQQLRDAAQPTAVDAYLKQHPFISLSLAFVGGVLLSDKRVAKLLIRSGLNYISAIKSA